MPVLDGGRGSACARTQDDHVEMTTYTHILSTVWFLAMVYAHARLSNALRPPFLAASSRRHPPRTRCYASLTAEDTFVQSRINTLRRVLLIAGDPSRIYTHYTNFVNFFSPTMLPLELHRQVLRRCSPPPHTLRIIAAKHLLEGRKPERPHMHEGRFQTIIGNIRALGRVPSLDDYHHVLEQFAAVGHFIGSLQVYQEIIHLGLTPEHKTIALFLQALAHRHSLPILRVYQPRLASQTRKILDDLLSDMRKYNIHFTQPIFDLTLRVFKESVDKDGFDRLLKWAYGIDLANLDCPPLELLRDAHRPPKRVTIPFSIHALNTIIDTLGRFGDISRLVQAFEVLTQPLPQASQYRFSSFDDDQGSAVPVENPSPSDFVYPFAEPNTTTYNMLLRYIGQANHAILARHYLIQVMRLDREVNWKLRQQIEDGVPLGEIPAPRLSVNRRMFLSVFGHSNRSKNLGLMRWLSTKLPKVQRFKIKDLDFYTQVRDRLDALPSETLPDTQSTSTPLPSDDFRTLLPTMVDVLMAPSQKISVDLKNMGKAFDVDVDDLSIPQPPPEKKFNIDLHIRILTQDIEEIAAFAQDLDHALGRTYQRSKERLGRRVWEGKDVYLSDVDRRTKISRQRWRHVVGFRPRRELLRRQSPQSPFEKDAAPHLSL